MSVAILGTDRMGLALARRLVRAGHRVTLGSRDNQHGRELASVLGAAGGGDYALAASQGEIVLLALEWSDVFDALRAAGDLAGKVVVDCTNPESPDGGLALGHSRSGAEEIARASPGARVVKAFNHVYAELLDSGGGFGERTASVFLCGDELSATSVVADLISSCGFAPVHVGSLAMARHLEPLAMLMVGLVRRSGYPPADAALAILRR